MFHNTLTMINKKNLAWFTIDYFTHNLDLISQARKNFRPQNTNDDTALSEQSTTFGTLNGLILHL